MASKQNYKDSIIKLTNKIQRLDNDTKAIKYPKQEQKNRKHRLQNELIDTKNELQIVTKYKTSMM